MKELNRSENSQNWRTYYDVLGGCCGCGNCTCNCVWEYPTNWKSADVETSYRTSYGTGSTI